MPAEKTRQLSYDFLFTLIYTDFEVVCTVCDCCSYSKKYKVPGREDQHHPSSRQLTTTHSDTRKRHLRALLPSSSSPHLADFLWLPTRHFSKARNSYSSVMPHYLRLGLPISANAPFILKAKCHKKMNTHSPLPRPLAFSAFCLPWWPRGARNVRETELLK